MARKDKDRAERLAAALRENLKRRKAQARGTPEEETENGESSRRRPGSMNTDSGN
jgi:hypothetical protein